MPGAPASRTEADEFVLILEVESLRITNRLEIGKGKAESKNNGNFEKSSLFLKPPSRPNMQERWTLAQLKESTLLPKIYEGGRPESTFIP